MLQFVAIVVLLLIFLKLACKYCCNLLRCEAGEDSYERTLLARGGKKRNTQTEMQFYDVRLPVISGRFLNYFQNVVKPQTKEYTCNGLFFNLTIDRNDFFQTGKNLNVRNAFIICIVILGNFCKMSIPHGVNRI